MYNLCGDILKDNISRVVYCYRAKENIKRGLTPSFFVGRVATAHEKFSGTQNKFRGVLRGFTPLKRSQGASPIKSVRLHANGKRW